MKERRCEDGGEGGEGGGGREGGNSEEGVKAGIGVEGLGRSVQLCRASNVHQASRDEGYTWSDRRKVWRVEFIGRTWEAVRRPTESKVWAANDSRRWLAIEPSSCKPLEQLFIATVEERRNVDLDLIRPRSMSKTALLLITCEIKARCHWVVIAEALLPRKTIAVHLGAQMETVIAETPHQSQITAREQCGKPFPRICRQSLLANLKRNVPGYCNNISSWGYWRARWTQHRGWHWGAGGNGEGPQLNMSGANIGSLAVHGDVYLNPETRNKSLAVMRQKHHKLCPLPVSSFKGRKDILQEMHQHFDCDQGSQHIFVLHGLGGAGKSQLSFKFLQDSQAHHRFSEIFYIDATNEQTIETDLKTVAPVVVGESTEAILHWLASKQEEWLLLFDNADDVQLDISKFFPCCTFGNILITTRNQELCIHATAGSRVSDMELDDAKDLLLQLAYQGRSDKQEKLSSDEQEKLAVAIVKELYCFPLAVSQAGGYIHARGKLSKYLKLYQNHRDQLLQRAEICSSLHHKGILEQMFEKAAMSQKELDDSELQKKVTQFLTELGKRAGIWDSGVFHEVIGELESYSLIERDGQDDSYHIHPLVQHWSGTTIGTSRHLLQKCVLAMIGLSISLSFQDEDYKYRHKLLQHVTRSIDSLNREEICTFVAARIRQVYFEGGCWKDAEALDVVMMEKSKHVLGEEHPDTLTSMANLAATYWNQGRWKDAEALGWCHIWEQALEGCRGAGGGVMEKRKHVLGDEHPDTLRSMANLAATYGNQGHWKDAEALEVVVMEKRKHVLERSIQTPDKHGQSCSHILEPGPPEGCRGTPGGGDGEEEASTYRNQGCWKDAEALEVVVMEKSKQVLGEEHPSTLTSMANLAATYWNQGRWKDAEALEVVVMEKSKHVLGEEHPSTLLSMANLAATYWNQGRWKDSEALEVVVMEKSKHVLGEEHPDTLLSMANLAATYRSQGRWKDAEALDMVVMEKSKCGPREEHPDTLTSTANLGVK
ncbi:hypothetical protein B0H13DRAFT_2277916 [Mycena leptocephala]|nr:hypothetical protein B0H13DRAFT_2277916 [Mycena leptocephala]